RACDSGKDVVVARMCTERPVNDAEEIRLRALRDYSISNQHRLKRAFLLCRLRCQDIGQQVDRFQIAPPPAKVGVRDDRGSRESELTIGDEGRRTSYTPSANTRPRSSTETRASARGKKAPLT